MKLQKKRLFSRGRWLVPLGVMVVIFFASLSWAMDAPHWYPNLPQGCSNCHDTHGPDKVCADCHTETPDPGDPLIIPAPAVGTHSSAIIGSDKYGTWEIACRGCHDEDKSDQISSRNGPYAEYPALVEGTFSGHTVDTVLVAGSDELWSFAVSALTINDPRWSDPATWGAKTGPDRGLILWQKQQGCISGQCWYGFVVKEATLNNIIIRVDPYYAPFDLSLGFYIHYGQLIDDYMYPYGGSSKVSVFFNGPSDFANDESGTGTDPSPNGICQVCHTQTTHWLSDGSGANHFSGWKCTLCHPHEEGFKAHPPLLCP